jgi:uncharacterized protein (DUF433 family)
MGKVVSLRLKDDQVDRLQRAARHLGRTPSETAALLLEEALRQREFAFVEFRDSPGGRRAYLQGTRLPIWQIAWIAREYGGEVTATAAHLGIPTAQVAAALRYAAAYPDEIAAAIADNQVAFTTLARQIPTLEAIVVDAAAP